jgi:hypothetical protein
MLKINKEEIVAKPWTRFLVPTSKNLTLFSTYTSPGNVNPFATLPFLEMGCACGVVFALKMVLPARNRLIFGR